MRLLHRKNRFNHKNKNKPSTKASAKPDPEHQGINVSCGVPNEHKHYTHHKRDYSGQQPRPFSFNSPIEGSIAHQGVHEGNKGVVQERPIVHKLEDPVERLFRKGEHNTIEDGKEDKNYPIESQGVPLSCRNAENWQGEGDACSVDKRHEVAIECKCNQCGHESNDVVESGWMG